MAVSGHNGNNETSIGLSNSMGLAFYDENNNEIVITHSQILIDVILLRDRNLPDYPFQYVNASEIKFSPGSFFLQNGMNITTINASVHIELKPINFNVGYLMAIKLGYSPIINSSYADFSSFKIICPSIFLNIYNCLIFTWNKNNNFHLKGELITQKNDSFYLFFQNMRQINGFKGFLGYSIRELNWNEMTLYCNTTHSSVKTIPLIQSQVNFTSDFMIRAYSSGCYYYDQSTGKWSSDGMEIYADTNLKQTHCSSYHLTSFAGGLVVVPSAINFQYVFANASFSQNPLIYSTVILITCVYILFAIWSKYMDNKDSQKMNIVQLKDNQPNDNYLYEMIVFTGNRSESGTHSKVI